MEPKTVGVAKWIEVGFTLKMKQWNLQRVGELSFRVFNTERLNCFIKMWNLQCVGELSFSAFQDGTIELLHQNTCLTTPIPQLSKREVNNNCLSCEQTNLQPNAQDAECNTQDTQHFKFHKNLVNMHSM